jgi:hypothetical protein
MSALAVIVSLRAKITPPYLYQKLLCSLKNYMDNHGLLQATATREFHPGMVLMPPPSLAATLLTLGL